MRSLPHRPTPSPAALWPLLLAAAAGHVMAQPHAPPQHQRMRTPVEAGSLVMRVENVPQPQSVHQYLERRGVVADRPTVDAFRTLNPQVTPANRIPAHTRVTAFVPEAAPVQPAGTPMQPPPRARVDMGRAVRNTAALEVDRASRTQLTALQLPPTAYRSPADLSRHRDLLASVDTTARLVAQRADTLPARDLALSRYYLRNANVAAQQLNSEAAVRPLGEADVQRLAAASQPVQAMQARMARGEAPIAYRQITVHVRSADGKELRDPLRVYVLPAGLLDAPDDPALILELLSQLSFERLTSPATGTVQDGEMRLWVGPDFQYEGMRNLVMAKQVTRYAPVRGHLGGNDAREPDLLFMAPASVTLPPPVR